MISGNGPKIPPGLLGFAKQLGAALGDKEPTKSTQTPQPLQSQTPQSAQHNLKMAQSSSNAMVQQRQDRAATGQEGGPRKSLAGMLQSSQLQQTLDKAQGWFGEKGFGKVGFGPGGGGSLTEARAEANIVKPGRGSVRGRGMPIRMKKDGTYDPKNLKAFDQFDRDPKTVGDPSRCAANSTVAALVLGGKDALLQGISNTRQAIEKDISISTNPGEARQAWSNELKQLDKVEKAVNNNTLDTNELNGLASTLYQVHDSDKGDKYMTYGDIKKMHKAVGLAGQDETRDSIPVAARNATGTASYTQNGPAGANVDPTRFKAAQQEVVNNIETRLQPGQKATIGVHEGGGVGMPNHIALAGKTKDGTFYVYNPIGNPNYLTGNAAKEHLTKRIGVSQDNPRNHLVGPTRERTTTFDLTATAPFTPITPQADLGKVGAMLVGKAMDFIGF